MRFLLDADDDWQERLRRWLYPRLHGVLSLVGAYGTGHTGYNQFVGTLAEDEEVIEDELCALGFERNPIACFKSLPDGRQSEGSWVLRSHDDPMGYLDRDRQLHVTLFACSDGSDGRELYAHEEFDWQDKPLKHLRAEEFDPQRGADYARLLVDNDTFLTFT